jgi:hypothetical protein
MDYNKQISAKINGINGKFFFPQIMMYQREVLFPADYADKRRFQKGFDELKELV